MHVPQIQHLRSEEDEGSQEKICVDQVGRDSGKTVRELRGFILRADDA
jgi:hypothetical protein